MWDEIKDEKELLLKLFRTGHLNVPERKNLPNGKVRVSVAQDLITEILNTYGWFPWKKQYPIGDAGGEYLQLEFGSDGNSFLHQNYEYGYLKYSTF